MIIEGRASRVLCLCSFSLQLQASLAILNVNDEHPSWVNAPEPGRKVLWVHIHKAAGNLMCALAKQSFERAVVPEVTCNYAGPGHWDMFHTSQSNDHIIEGYSCEERSRLYDEQNATWGQIERQLLDSDLCPGFTYGTMLRNPLTLMLSYVNFLDVEDPPDFPRGKSGLDALRIALRKNKTGPTQHSGGRWKMFDNYQTRVFANAMDVPAGRIDESHVDLARHRLQRFKIVSRLEDLMPDHPMFDVLGWPDVVRFTAIFPTNVNVHTTFFNETERAWLAELNRHDIALYQSFART